MQLENIRLRRAQAAHHRGAIGWRSETAAPRKCHGPRRRGLRSASPPSPENALRDPAPRALAALASFTVSMHSPRSSLPRNTLANLSISPGSPETSIRVSDAAAGLNQSGSCNVGFVHQHARRNAEVIDGRIWFAVQHPRKLHLDGTDADVIADLRVQPSKQHPGNPGRSGCRNALSIAHRPAWRIRDPQPAAQWKPGLHPLISERFTPCPLAGSPDTMLGKVMPLGARETSAAPLHRGICP